MCVGLRAKVAGSNDPLMPELCGLRGYPDRIPRRAHGESDTSANLAASIKVDHD